MPLSLHRDFPFKAEIRDDFHRIVSAGSADGARAAYAAFERTWATAAPEVITSLREGDDELLEFFSFPKAQWKTLRTTNTMSAFTKSSAGASRRKAAG